MMNQFPFILRSHAVQIASSYMDRNNNSHTIVPSSPYESPRIHEWVRLHWVSSFALTRYAIAQYRMSHALLEDYYVKS